VSPSKPSKKLPKDSNKKNLTAGSGSGINWGKILEKVIGDNSFETFCQHFSERDNPSDEQMSEVDINNSYEYFMKSYLMPEFKPFKPIHLSNIMFFAVYWWRKAADQGLPEAQFLLASAYSDGNVFYKNSDKAIYWWRKAAENGHLMSKLILDDLGISY
jgi:hypothetical protein